MRETYTPSSIARELERFLHKVQRPARYVGGEWNQVVKDWDATPIHVALVFPDIYDLGMSNLGLAILYDVLNRDPHILAERVFLPWVDMEAEMRARGIPLYSLESKHPLRDFDLVGVSVPYEQLYTNVLNMLDLAGIPLRAADRGDDDPLIVAGGSGVTNPEPMWAFFDAFFIGEGEEAILELARAAHETRGQPRYERWKALARIPGVYVPHFYRVSYNEDGTVRDVSPTEPEAAMPVLKRIVPLLPPPVTRFIVPYIDIVHNRGAVEIMRGCTRGCRYCHAGMIYRPVRNRPLEEVLQAVDDIVRHTGFEEISLLSLSSSDYEWVGELVQELTRRYKDKRLALSLPSLRIESFSVDLMEALEGGRRRSGFTFAPEAATDRLRDVINKPIPTQQMLDVAEEVYRRGWTTIKMYFMIGHPTQTREDVEAIVDLAHRVLAIGRKHLGRKAKVRVGVSTLVPKPHTPFQWVELAGEEEIWEQIHILQRGLKKPGFHLSWNHPHETLVEAFLSRGDRRLADVIERAWQLGAKFDAWGDQFRYDAWMRAFAEAGLDPEWYARRPRDLNEILPWDHINVGVKKAFLQQEYLHALQGAVIDDCREYCYSCGILTYFKHLRRQVPDEAWGCPPLGRGKKRQPVAPRPVPMYVNEEMSPDLAAKYGPRRLQRESRTPRRNPTPVTTEQKP